MFDNRMPCTLLSYSASIVAILHFFSCPFVSSKHCARGSEFRQVHKLDVNEPCASIQEYINLKLYLVSEIWPPIQSERAMWRYECKSTRFQVIFQHIDYQGFNMTRRNLAFLFIQMSWFYGRYIWIELRLYVKCWQCLCRGAVRSNCNTLEIWTYSIYRDAWNL